MPVTFIAADVQPQSDAADFFQFEIHRIVEAQRSHYGTRLIAIYVWGSVFRGEGIPGVSDADTATFTTDGFGEADARWKQGTEERLEQEIRCPHPLPRAHRLEDTLFAGLEPGAGDGARTGARAWAYRLKYDSALVWGRDLLAGCAHPAPDRRWARCCFESPYHVVRYAAGLEMESETDFDFPLPHQPALRLRKLARLAVLGGAHLLMALGRFNSYRVADVLPALRASCPQFIPFLDETGRLQAVVPDGGEARLAMYLPRLVRWMEWVNQQLKRDDEAHPAERAR